MNTPPPDDQVRFVDCVLENRFARAEQVAEALELYRRYQAAGGEVPSLARIMIAKGMLERPLAEAVLRHLMDGEPLPKLQPSSRPQSSQLEADLAESGDNDDDEDARADAASERQALIEGMGALVLPKDLRDLKGYKILSVIGEGSSGITYKAQQISMNRVVALKVLSAAKTRDPAYVQEFLAEARNAGRLNHPSLIRVHEVGKSGGTYYYSMEYLEGQRLDEWMDECEGGRIEPRQAIQVFVQVAAALEYGFRSGVIHREIRPNTIMFSSDGHAKLADLGLVKDEQSRFVAGENAHYVAPEQIQHHPADTRTDIYCLGCCLYHSLTGEAPFAGKQPKEILERHLHGAPPNPRLINPRICRELATVVVTMMARDPKMRFQTPADVVTALKKASFAQPPSVAKPILPAAKLHARAAHGRKHRRRRR